MELIEMVAYIAAHATDEVPWRCMRCEKLTRHANEDITAHLYGAHGLSAFQLKTEQDAMFLYPPEGETNGKLHEEFSQEGCEDQAGKQQASN